MTCGIRPTSELTALFDSAYQNGISANANNHLSHFVTVGSTPFIGTWTGQEKKISSGLINDVTSAVTNKVVSTLSGFLSWSKQTDQQKYSSSTENQQSAIELPKPLTLKYLLMDRARVGKCICASPNHRLAAITDNFNRIYVFDLELSVIIKQFKGYREAQVGWVRSVQDGTSEKRNSRATQFLVILSPRRCLLEVWGGERWERIHSCDVPPNSRLLYCPHAMLGWTRSLMPSDSILGSSFLVSSTGPIFSVEVAFHWAVADRNRAKLLDQSLVRNLIVDGKLSETFLEVVAKMQLDETRDHAVQLIVKNLQNNPEKLITCLTDLLSVSKRMSAEEGQRFHMLCSKLLAGLNLYLNLNQFSKGNRLVRHASSTSVNLDALLSTFSLGNDVKESYKEVFQVYCLVNGEKINKSQQKSIVKAELLGFLQSLGLMSKPGESKNNQDITMGGYLFGPLFEMEDFTDRLQQFEAAISIFASQLFTSQELLRILLNYFFSTMSPWLVVEHLSLLFALIQMLSRFPNGNDERQAFWNLALEMCENSCSHVKALTICLICSQISVKALGTAPEEQSSLLEMAGDWDCQGSSAFMEEFSIDDPLVDDRWLNLCKQLTILSVFEMIFQCTPESNQAAQESEGWDMEIEDDDGCCAPQISSKMIAVNGSDLICEHLSRWIVSSKFNLANFLASNHQHPTDASNLLTIEATLDFLLWKLVQLLPWTLSRDNLFSGCSWHCAILWSRQEIVKCEPFLLQASLNYAKLISENNKILKIWLMDQIWSKLVKPSVQNLFNLIIKLERVPKELEIGDGLTIIECEQMLDFTSNLFKILIETEVDDETTSEKCQNSEEMIWPKPMDDLARLSLSEQAWTSGIRLRDETCLKLHWEAATAMRMIFQFNIRTIHLEHLFSHIVRCVFFSFNF